MHYFTIFCAVFVFIPLVELFYVRQWPQAGATAYWRQCPANTFPMNRTAQWPVNRAAQCPVNITWGGYGGGYATMGGKSSGRSMGARCPNDYTTMLKFANRKLARYGSFVKPILKAVGKALRGRTLDFVRLIGTGTMNPKMSNGYKGSVYQIALALQIFNRFKHSGTKVLYQELVMGPGERNFWSKYGRALMGNETELTRIPTGATPKRGVTLLYVIGAPTELIEQLLQAYRSFLGKIMFITDDITLMDETFLGYRPGSNFTRIRALSARQSLLHFKLMSCHKQHDVIRRIFVARMLSLQMCVRLPGRLYRLQTVHTYGRHEGVIKGEIKGVE
ncbi:hypothetical protein DdX_16138 [Ditylenchus destructor]|uniref:SRR1-like domain-containing protein n=1 Tax=Ditylenchus destructor TaxID=166010 RepID=A0AAD4MQY6_9BILA|nr:hypothetical protein DdX_16138 [Ditylenchus destructor]